MKFTKESKKMKVELTEIQSESLLAIINGSNIKGGHAEMIVDLKKALTTKEIEFSERQVENLMGLINSAAISGGAAEAIVDIKKVLTAGLMTK
jgi:pyridoxine 5'-phosphate synthase PdxJ